MSDRGEAWIAVGTTARRLETEFFGKTQFLLASAPFRRLFPVLLLLLLMLPAVVHGQQVTDDQVNEIAKDVYCPVCESTPLDVCPTQACADWRELIRVKLGEGQSRNEILDYFARQYGDGVLSNPPRRGISLIILWILPVLGVLLGLLLFSRVLRGLRTAAPEPAAAPRPKASTGDPDMDNYIARIEKEVGE